MKLFRVTVLLALSGFATAAFADDAYAWLLRMNQASRVLSYTGTFIYQSQGRSETSRIFHLVDASGEHERLETLEGPPREVLRHNDEVQCFLPQDRILVQDKVVQGRQPGRLLTKPAALAEFYSIHMGESGRVAGRDAQQLVLEPRDDMRYAHHLWIDVSSGLLLKTRTLDEQAKTVEQLTFSEVVPGAVVDHEKLKPRSVRTAEWRVINARGVDIRPEDVEWGFRKLPPGFRVVSIVRRAVRRGDASAVHAVFSDGLASVSVFVELAAGAVASSARSGAVATGSTGIYRSVLGDRQVTVLGEVPAKTLRRFAEGLERLPKK